SSHSRKLSARTLIRGEGAVARGRPRPPRTEARGGDDPHLSGNGSTCLDAPDRDRCRAPRPQPRVSPVCNIPVDDQSRIHTLLPERCLLRHLRPVYELPAGEVRMATGYQSRRNSGLFNPDILQSQVSFTDQVIGVYPTGYLDAETSVDDYYIEGLIPVLQGKRFAERLELELGARYSDYEHTEEETTWKSLINWQVNDMLRFRGGFNRATRAPNLGELFLNPQEIFTGGGLFGDPCGVGSNSPFGAGGTSDDPVLSPGETNPPPLAAGQTPDGAMSTRMICEAMMGGPGSSAVTQFYELNNAPAAGGGGFAWVLQRGNPNLRSEVADTWTWGFVLNLRNNMTWAVDWYKVDIEDAIMLYSLTYASYQCFGTRIVTTPQEAAEQAQTEACRLVPRDLNNGAALTAMLQYDNHATIKTSGVDIAWNWLKPVGAANLNFNLQATV